jgi:HEAT repeat protein
MREEQLDLFSGRVEVEQSLSRAPCSNVPARALDDETLIAALPGSDLSDSCALAAEAGKRRLAAAVPVLAALCRRFAGFGVRRTIPEQAAAIEALVMIGSRDAAFAVADMIEQAIAQGPGLRIAVSAAAQLGSTLSADVLRQLLRHPEPPVRADACRCARPLPELILLLVDLLDDLDPGVAAAAACALGRMGRVEARSSLKGLLRESPSEEAIDAVCLIADEECAVLLGRIARSESILAVLALDALENIETPRAAAVAAAVRRAHPPRQNSQPHMIAAGSAPR